MGAFAKFMAESRAKQLDTWEGEGEFADPLAKGPGYGQPVPDRAEFERRFLSPAKNKEPAE
ncbi:hypothetical protein A3F55_00850 [Candidatus Adlerbacteria bacterium RIFCSPHIGHO2_12_FULL_53_18]|uniref:Uncharacterized protein n=1 Tax=Candidatus Adlerbacteria bacterium RIFCSPHIGHO2_12_FULL_53_18 TaxID=1797242 RepID=A0A1F4XSD5_9BACT|nr:MAG: hypothetical protein A3F55_00850 [Candidatus Adlerbacteria bacterium RIFCSPHIGHO2_12_FULL_53_18]